LRGVVGELTSLESEEYRRWLLSARASFDRLRMRAIEKGIEKMPGRADLILSLSKDAPTHVKRGGSKP
jgi:hypothetical protein